MGGPNYDEGTDTLVLYSIYSINPLRQNLSALIIYILRFLYMDLLTKLSLLFIYTDIPVWILAKAVSLIPSYNKAVSHFHLQ
jgi:hypothetical protein